MNRTEYIGKLNALYVGDKNCLEELITTYDEKDKEIERLNNIIDELEKYCIDEKEDLISGCEVCEDILKMIDKLKVEYVDINSIEGVQK